MRLPVLLALWLTACGGSLAPPDPGSTKPVVGAGFIGVEVRHLTTAVTVAIDRQAKVVDALFAPAPCVLRPPGPMPIVGGYVSAGTIEVDDLEKTVLEPQADGSYASPGASSTIDLVADLPVTVTATGGDIPAFAMSLAAPPELAIDSPDPNKAPSMVDGTQDLAVTWGPRPGATVRVALYANDLLLACDFASETGSGTLPGAEISKLGTTDANLVASVFSSSSITSGAVPIELRATLAAIAPSGLPYLYAFSLQ
jgi:hypothetical protein